MNVRASDAPGDHLETRRCYGCGTEFVERANRYRPWCIWCDDEQRKAAKAPARDRRLDEEAEYGEQMRNYRRDVL